MHSVFALIALVAAAFPAISAPIGFTHGVGLELVPNFNESNHSTPRPTMTLFEDAVKGDEISSQPSRRDILIQRGLSSIFSSILGKLFSAGEKDLPSSVATNSIEGVFNGILDSSPGGGNNTRRAPPGSIDKGLVGTTVGLGASALTEEAIDEFKKIFRRELELRGSVAGEVVEDTLKDVIGKNVVAGVSSATGGTVVGEVANKFFKRNITEVLTSEEATLLKQLLQTAAAAQTRDLERRGSIAGDIKSGAGQLSADGSTILSGAHAAGTTGPIELETESTVPEAPPATPSQSSSFASILDELKSIIESFFRRELDLDELE